MPEEFIGRGWGFPLRPSTSGGIGMVTGHQELSESIRLILSTAYGERPMRPEFGCGIHEYVFASVNAATAGRIAAEVKASLTRWEPRVDVADVDVKTNPEEPSTLYIDIKYRERNTNDPRNLVFPFYLIPEEG
jgi:phage baseplate assembly protein W